MSKNKVFILAPHTDDGELGCGGKIAQYIYQLLGGCKNHCR